jgi:hypothetical protein
MPASTIKIGLVRKSALTVAKVFAVIAWLP